MASITGTKRPIITLFTSIRNIGPALRQTAELPLVEIVDEDALGGFGGTVHFNPSKLQDSTVRQLKESEILITEPAVLADLLTCYEVSDLFPNLKFCQTTYAGVDPLFKKNIPLPLPFTLARFSGVFGPPIAEYVLGQIISHERGFQRMRRDQAEKVWAGDESILNYRYLSDLTISILGAGDIGMCIARAAKTFGMKTVGFSTSKKKEPMFLDESEIDLTTVLQAGDYVVNVLPSTSSTRNLLTVDTFSMANQSNGGKSPVFLNVGRGDVTTTESILHSLESRHISAAVLDVFEEEPLPQTSPLWDHPLVTISPHVSGLTRGQDVPDLVLKQYERYVGGKPLLYIVDWNKSY